MRLAAALCIVLGFGGFIAWRLTYGTPKWWSPPPTDDPAVVDRADRFEFWVLERTHAPREADSTWAIELREQDINSWLAVRLEGWLSHAQDVQWPAELGLPQVHIEPEGIDVGLEILTEDRVRFVVARLLPEVRDQQLALTVDRASLGRLHLPGAPIRAVLEPLYESLPKSFRDQETVAESIDVLLDGLQFESLIELADDRRLDVLGVTCKSGAIVLRCRTIGGGASRVDSQKTNQD